MSYRRAKKVLITDLDNTLWDWFDAWHQAFSAMLGRLTELSGVPQEVLEGQIREIHRDHGTTEYSWLVREIPALIDAAAPADPAVVYDEAVHVLNSRRKAATKLYPGVRETLTELKAAGVRIVAYTESIAFWSEWRVRQTGLDGVIDALYSAPDHDPPSGRSLEELRRFPPSEYGLKKTLHKHTPPGVLKPSALVLRTILDKQGAHPDEAVYIGDSLMKDIVMAQHTGVLDVHAKYGEAQSKAGYDLLRRVSHWSDDDVARERAIAESSTSIVPTIACDSFDQLLPLFKQV